MSLAPVSDIPTTGTATYDFAGGTTAFYGTKNFADPGTMSGQVAVQFGDFPRIGLDLAFDFGSDGEWTIFTRGGVDEPNLSPIAIEADATFAGRGAFTFGTDGDCENGCDTQIEGGLSGAGANAVGLSFRSIIGGSGFYGLAAFTKSDGATSGLASPSAAATSTAVADWSRWQGPATSVSTNIELAAPALGGQSVGYARTVDAAEKVLGGTFTFER